MFCIVFEFGVKIGGLVLLIDVKYFVFLNICLLLVNGILFYCKILISLNLELEILNWVGILE